MIVYKITNLINGKIYIGKDTKNNPKYYGSGILIKKAIKKYGKNNFSKEILENCSDENTLNEKEIYWISYFRNISGSCCYNIATGGEGSDNITHHPDREKILSYIKERLPRGQNHHNYGKHSGSYGIKWTDEQKNNLKKSLKESQLFHEAMQSKERSKKISLKTKGKPKSAEFIQKNLIGINNPMYGKNLTEDHKRKISESIKKSDKFKQAMKSEERSKKISIQHKGKIISEETKSKLRGTKNPMYGKTHSEENKIKMSFPLGKNPNARPVLIENENKILEFDCVTNLAKYLNVARTTAGQYAKNQKKLSIGKIIYKDEYFK